MALQMLICQRAIHRERVFRDRINPVERYDDQDFVARYRLPKAVVLEVVDCIKLDIERPTKRSGSVPAVLQVCATLQFLACGNFQRSTGDLHGLSKSSVSRSIHSVTAAISRRRDYIKFSDSGPDLLKVKQGFERYAGFPNVIGAIDGTQIALKAPTDEEWIYVNRKGYHSLNVQVRENTIYSK